PSAHFSHQSIRHLAQQRERSRSGQPQPVHQPICIVHSHHPVRIRRRPSDFGQPPPWRPHALHPRAQQAMHRHPRPSRKERNALHRHRHRSGQATDCWKKFPPLEKANKTRTPEFHVLTESLRRSNQRRPNIPAKPQLKRTGSTESVFQTTVTLH
uniref:Uncharacterized protein n=1 Tax=Physcomitrium patens TaxID=3218 RepID=A0A7I4D0H9_PHYPA